MNTPKWKRVEAGYYTWRISPTETLELVYASSPRSPAELMHGDYRWGVRLVEKIKPTATEKGSLKVRELHRTLTMKEAKESAVEWHAKRAS